MPKLNHNQLMEWYAKFKKAVYEGANIDMDRIEDIGRLKIAYPTKWDVEEPTGTEGDYMYACIPHNELEYEDTPPDYAQPAERLQWIMDNLRVPSTDEEIQKLYDMSREGTLMAILPGGGDIGIQQVYTDEVNRIRVSLPMNVTEDADPFDLDPEYRIPDDPGNLVKEPNPADFGLPEGPRKPVPPENMNPGFWSWVGYLIGINTDYKKLKTYEEEMETFDDRFQKWYDSLDPEKSTEERRIGEYLEAKHAREQFEDAVHAFWADPIGKAAAIGRGFSAQKTDLLGRPDHLGENIHAFQAEETKFMKQKNSNLPQGQIRKRMEDVEGILAFINRTKHTVTNMVGNKPRMEDLSEWIDRKIFTPDKHHPQEYDVPKHPDYNNVEPEVRVAYRKKWEKLAEIVGFAAASHPDVCGNPPFEGFTADETAQLHYTQTLYNVFTAGRKNSDFYVDFMEPARMKAKEAIFAYHKGELGQLADIMANGIRKNNREVACLSSVTSSSHSIDTLYLVDRMWNVLNEDKELLKATGLTPEEIEETKANAALFQVVKKGLESQRDLLEYALHQRKMTPAQVRQAGADMLLAYQLGNDVSKEFNQRAEEQMNDPKYMEAFAKMRTDPDRANREMDLINLQKPGYTAVKNLAKDNYISDVKAAMIQECNLNKLTEMSREDMAKLVASESAFVKEFTKQPASLAKAQAPAKVNAIQHEVAPQQPQQQPQQRRN